MCNCVPLIPFPSSIVKIRNPLLKNPQVSDTHFPIITNNGRLHFLGCCMRATPSSSSSVEGDGYGQLEFDDDELELKRRRTDATLEKISDKELKGKKGNKNGDKLVSRKQLMKRSNMVAKQVISIQSAQTLGFVSQLWADTTSWLVLAMEVRPSLLAGQSERILLQDINKVGDVVLVEDERVMDNDFKMVRLETLVGYRVVTPRYRNIGKVRGYTFNINSGAVESLELDSFGISIIPSSLVSTYALLVEDVLEVIADRVVVHEAAASRLQRLTKGFWDAQSLEVSLEEHIEYGGDEGSEGFRDGRRSRRRSRGRKPRSKSREADDDWELPIDYF
ncbi:hypothetical protein E1A91_A02G002800v1 [Gossypium mustelinum]|uniref:PRC-barrel domain-containing protein n=1 Tax=Gossypium mustelinum TaxID=34275 RepID=A0A5D3A035_GOSMU|nr:hypothetical protein E1A91_A02G002800v1 [Gossypium mustelinum]